MPDTFQISNPAPGTMLQDATLQSLVTQLRPLMSILAQTGAANGFIIQAEVPTAAQRGQIWFRMSSDDSTGVLVGTFFYLNGVWCRQYNFMPGVMMAWDGGDPSNLFNLTTGKGLFTSSNPQIAGDFYGWQLVLAGNANGIPALFPVSASRWNASTGLFDALLPDPTGVETAGIYSSTGGSAVQTILTQAMIPSLPITLDFTGYQMVDDPVDYGGVGSSQTIVDNRWKDNPVAPATLPTASFTNPNITTAAPGALPTAVPYQFPPYKVIPWLKWLGYVYVDPTIA